MCLMNGIKIDFYFIFVYNGVNSPFICDFVKPTLIYQSKVLLLILLLLLYVFRTMSIIKNLDIFRHMHVLFRHIQPYCSIFRTLYNSSILRNLPYSEYWHIQHPRYIQNSVKDYSSIFGTLRNDHLLRTMPYSQLCHIQNFGVFSTQGILRILLTQAHSDIFRHIQ